MGKKVKIGINDIATTHPQFIKYFLNREESELYSYGSSKRLDFKCPNCGHIKNIPIQRLINQGLGCQQCSDGFSFGEKFIFNLLKQLGVEFTFQLNQKHLEWCEKFRYDFYLPAYDTIIEVHGQQHYIKSFESCGGNTLEEVKLNDEKKRFLAMNNGVSNYIVIDAQKSESKYLINSILNSKLNEVFDLSQIDFNLCAKNALNSLMFHVCKLWNDGNSVKDILDETQLSRSTVCRYLNEGYKLKVCNYNGQNETSIYKPKKVLVIDRNNKYHSFNSMRECEAKSESIFGVKLRHINRYIDTDKEYKGFIFKSIK